MHDWCKPRGNADCAYKGRKYLPSVYRNRLRERKAMVGKSSDASFDRQSASKKHTTVRHLFQAVFFALTNGYASGFFTGKIYRGANKRFCVPGLNCYSCPGALYACPIGALQATLNSREFKLSCYVFGFLMMVGAIFGRFVCGWLCPFGFIQDLLHKIPFPDKKKNLPAHKQLIKLKYAVLLIMVFLLPALAKDSTGLGQPWFCEYICPSGTLLAGMPMIALNPGLRESIGPLFFWKLGLLIVIIMLAVKYYRPFCKYLCPLGAFYSVFNPIAVYRFNIDKDKCIGCGACQRVCGMDIRVWEQPNSTECIRCGSCKAVCPNLAITSGLDVLKERLITSRTVDISIASEEGSKTNVYKILLGFIGISLNSLLISAAIFFAAVDMVSQTSGGGVTWLNLFKHNFFWVLWITGIAVSFAASVKLMLSAKRPIISAEALNLQLYAFILVLAGAVLWLLRYAYAAFILILGLIPGQTVFTLLVFITCFRDTRLIKRSALH